MSKRLAYLVFSLFFLFFSISISYAFITETVSTESTSAATTPSLTADTSYVYAVWCEIGSDGYTHIYYKRKPLTGSWENYPRELVSTQQVTDNAYNPKIAVDSNYVYVVWEDESNYGSGGKRNIVYKRKDLNGSWASYSTEVVATETTGEAFNGQIAIDSSYVYVVWEDTGTYSSSGTDRDIFYKRKTLDGSWPTTTELVSSESNLDSYKPVLAVDSTNVYVAWYDYDSSGLGTGANIFYKKKAKNGNWPTQTERVSTETISTSSWADMPTVAIAVDSTYVHLAWRDNTDYGGYGSNFHIVYKKKTIDGTWPVTTEVVSTESTGTAMSPCIGVDAFQVYLAWSDNSNYNSAGTNWHIFFKKKNITGTWGTDTQIISNESTGNAVSPKMFIRTDTTPSTIHIIWEDNTDLGYGSAFSHIVYRKLQSNPPTVTVTYPNGGESLSGTVKVQATATDPDNNITSVAFYYTADEGKTSTLIGTDTTSPYEYEWDTTKVTKSGNYKIKAIVTSDDGGQGTDLSDGYFYVNKYATDGTFNIYTFVTDATATCYKGHTLELPLSSEANSGDKVTDTSKLQNGDTVFEQSTTDADEYTYMKFNFKIIDVVADIKSMYIYWEGITITGNSGVNLYLWNNTTNSYEKITSYAYDPNDVGVHILSIKMTSGFSKYIKADGTLQILVETSGTGAGLLAHTKGVYTDFIKVEVSTDVTPPATINNLQAASGANRGQIILTWTAPGDDGNLRTATSYIVKYATTTFGESNWNSSWVKSASNLPTPQEAGNTETMTMTLTPGIQYWFRIKTQDEVPNTSDIDTTNPQATAIAKANAAPIAIITTPSGTQTKNVTINYTLFDAEADTCSINVAYSKDGGTTFATATQGQGGDTVTGLTASSTTATSHSFVWDSVEDLPESLYTQVQIRIIPIDSYGSTGNAATTGNFSIDNLGIAIGKNYNFPNPFTPKKGNLTISYILKKETDVDISIYNINGELIKKQDIPAGATGAIQGTNKITWDGKNEQGEYIASGVYLICIEADGSRQVQKVAVIK